MGKRLGLKVNGRYREVAAIRRWPHLEVRLTVYIIRVYYGKYFLICDFSKWPF